MIRACPTLIAVAALTGLACSSDPLWRGSPQPSAPRVAAVFADDRNGLQNDDRPEDVPRVPMRTRVRPCCAFGTDLGVRVGSVAVPIFAIGNVRSADDIGHHSYDSGRGSDGHSGGPERNGLVYTCRGGFIDTAHVRDYMDWTLYLSTRFGRELETGTTINFPDPEGGHRRIVLQPLAPELIRAHGRRALSIALGQWAAYQMSLWHEVATWFGWSFYGPFPERASAFSPEDVFSNVVGIKMAGAVIWQGTAFSEGSYNAAVDQWLEQTLRYLGAVPANSGVEAVRAVDQLWWDSGARLPDPHLVRRRNIQGGSAVWPWTVPANTISPSLRNTLETKCEGDTQPQPMRVASRVAGLVLERVLRLEVELDPALASKEPFASLGPVVSQRDFPRILEAIREQNRFEFGPDADSRVGGSARFD